MRRWVAVLLVALTVGAPGARAAPAANARELEAREAFVTADYPRALRLFGKLYAETLHPTYLRNIGRCYQKMGDADRAIGSFRDYLRKAGALPASERAEIDGYIAEMEALRRSRAPAAVVSTVPPPPPEARPSGRRWIWWAAAGVGLAALGGMVAALAVARGADAPCPGGTTCLRP